MADGLGVTGRGVTSDIGRVRRRIVGAPGTREGEFSLPILDGRSIIPTNSRVGDVS